MKGLMLLAVLLFYGSGLQINCSYQQNDEATDIKEWNVTAEIYDIRETAEGLRTTNSLTIEVMGELLNETYHVVRDGSILVSKLPVFYFHNNRKKRITVEPNHGFIGRDATRDCDVSFNTKITRDLVFLSIVCIDAAYDLHLKKKKNRVYVGTAKIFRNAEEILLQHDMVVEAKHKQKRSIVIHDFFNADIKYLELFMIVDNALYTSIGMNGSIERSLEISQALDTIYRNLNVRIVLVGIEVWNEQNRIAVTSDATQTLNKLLLYAKTNITNADNIQMLSDQVFDRNVRGLAYVGTMCSGLYSGGLSSYQSKESHYSKVTGIVAHELGHNFNMRHDDTSKINCACSDPSGKCFMQSRISPATPKKFSQCSQNALYNYLHESYAMCMTNKPDNLISSSTLCGNNIVEEGEECDCGTPYFCTNLCCDPLTCRLQQGAECFRGACCHNCMFAPNTRMCRVQERRCDVMDYCSGRSEECTNVLVEDGISCADEGICMGGKCKSRTNQCKYLWGSAATVAVDDCYQGLNTHGQNYGHCGTVNATSDVHKPCELQNALCGALHCDNVTGFPVVGFSSSYVTVQIKSQGVRRKCSVGYADFGRINFIPGSVFDWTPCGTDKYCINNACVAKNLTSHCNGTCAPHEVCTNVGTCVCHEELKGVPCNGTQNHHSIHKHIVRDHQSHETHSLSTCVSLAWRELSFCILLHLVIYWWL